MPGNAFDRGPPCLHFEHRVGTFVGDDGGARQRTQLYVIPLQTKKGDLGSADVDRVNQEFTARETHRQVTNVTAVALRPRQHAVKGVGIVSVTVPFRAKVVDVDVSRIVDHAFPVKAIADRQRTAVIGGRGGADKAGEITAATEGRVRVVAAQERQVAVFGRHSGTQFSKRVNFDHLSLLGISGLQYKA